MIKNNYERETFLLDYSTSSNSTNNTSFTSIYSVVIPKNTLRVGSMIRVTILGGCQNTTSSYTLTLQTVIGGTSTPSPAETINIDATTGYSIEWRSWLNVATITTMSQFNVFKAKIAKANGNDEHIVWGPSAYSSETNDTDLTIDFQAKWSNSTGSLITKSLAFTEVCY